MKFLLPIAGAGIILVSAGANAQHAQGPAEPVQTQDIPPSETQQPPTGPDTGMPAFTDEQVTGFARAAMQMRELNSDSAMDETARRAQAEMIIAGEGLDPQTYSAIGAAAASDPALAVRVQQAIEDMAAEPEG